MTSSNMKVGGIARSRWHVQFEGMLLIPRGRGISTRLNPLTPVFSARHRAGAGSGARSILLPRLFPLLVTCLLVITAVYAGAEPITSLKPTGYVNDFAKVLDAGTAAQIEDLCHQVDEQAKAQIAVVTVHSLDGSDIESYAVSLFKAWGIGGKSSNRGVLILLAVDDHHYRIEVGYGLEPILPDGKVGGFGREAVPFFKQNDYSGGVKLLTQRTAQTIADDSHISLSGAGVEAPPEAPSQPAQHGISFFRIILIVIFVLLMIFTPLGQIFGLLSLFGGGRSLGGGGLGWRRRFWRGRRVWRLWRRQFGRRRRQRELVGRRGCFCAGAKANSGKRWQRVRKGMQ